MTKKSLGRPHDTAETLTKYAAMTETPLFTHQLAHHPTTPCAAVRALTVQVHAASRGGTPGLRWRYLLQGDICRTQLPALVKDPCPTDHLWQHTCFELFIGQAGQRAYREFNFSPSGHCASYAFSDERVRAAVELDLPPPGISLQRSPDCLVLEAWLPRLAIPLGEPCLMGLAAVIETDDDHLSYWALHHPAERPDFHRKAGWITSQICQTTS